MMESVIPGLAYTTRPQILSQFSAEFLFYSQCSAVKDQLLYKYYSIIAADSSDQVRESNLRLPPLGWNYLESNQGRRICKTYKPAPQVFRTPVCLTRSGTSNL
jgi:hypothetical protein